ITTRPAHKLHQSVILRIIAHSSERCRVDNCTSTALIAFGLLLIPRGRRAFSALLCGCFISTARLRRGISSYSLDFGKDLRCTTDFLKRCHVPRSDFSAHSFTRLNVVHMPPAKPQTGCSSSSENKTSDSPTSPTFTLSKVRLIKAPLSSTVDTSYRISHSPSSHELPQARDSSRASRG